MGSPVTHLERSPRSCRSTREGSRTRDADMDIPVTVTPPHTLDAIVRELGQVHGQSAAYGAAFPTAAFLAPLGAAWSPADNVRHLTKSIRAVARGLAMPRALLWVAFGP